jgi:RNA polymerase sigma-70 factor (ECF subfamily)
MAHEVTDAELVARARAGDAEAFCTLVERHQAAVRGHLARFLHGNEEIWDLAQESFLAAYESLGQFDPEREFLAWVRGIARYKALAHVRALLRRRQRETNAAEELVLLAEEQDLVAATGAEDDRRVRLAECLGKLRASKESLYRLVDLHYFQGRPAVELRALLGGSESSVRVTLLRARQILRACLEQEQAHMGGQNALP